MSSNLWRYFNQTMGVFGEDYLNIRMESYLTMRKNIVKKHYNV